MKIVKNATGVIEIRNSTTNELEKFFDPTGMIVNDHPRAADCICVSKTPAEQDETESINIRISDVTHVGGVEFTGETRASLKEAMVLLFRKGGSSGEGEQNIVIDRKTADYTLETGDTNKLIEMNVGSANTVTINNSVFSAGNQILVSQYGAGQVQLVAGSGVTLRSRGGKLKLAGQYAMATIVAISASEFYIVGDLTT